MTHITAVNVRHILAAAAALFAAYVVGRAAGILLGIGPYATEAVAVTAVVVAVARRRPRPGSA